MSSHYVTGRVVRAPSGERRLDVEPDLLEVDLEGAFVTLVYAVEASDRECGLAAAIEAAEAWSLRGAAHVRAVPVHLQLPLPDL